MSLQIAKGLDVSTVTILCDQLNVLPHLSDKAHDLKIVSFTGQTPGETLSVRTAIKLPFGICPVFNNPGVLGIGPVQVKSLYESPQPVSCNDEV